MPDSLRFLFAVSRPRFWFYVFGPYLVGAVAGIASLESISLILVVAAVYFVFPANLLIYGVNDIFDYETDRRNPKKTDYETLVTPERRRLVLAAIAISNIPFIAYLAFVGSSLSLIAMVGFLFFSIFYSAPPIRAKSKPVVDSAFNILYVFPGVVAFSLASEQLPPVQVLAAAGLWTMAMHAFSAIPDIHSDREAGIATVATLFGTKGTLILCLFLYLASATLSFPWLGLFALIAGIVYSTMILISLYVSSTRGVFDVYRYFPLVNVAVGFAMFWVIAWPKFL